MWGFVRSTAVERKHSDVKDEREDSMAGLQ